MSTRDACIVLTQNEANNVHISRVGTGRPPYFCTDTAYNAASILLTSAGSSGATLLGKCSITLPSRPIRYFVKFPMFSTSVVSGPNANPLHASLAKLTGKEPKWNFTKYLIGRDGKVIEHFPSKVAPEDPALVSKIEAAL